MTESESGVSMLSSIVAVALMTMAIGLGGRAVSGTLGAAERLSESARFQATLARFDDELVLAFRHEAGSDGVVVPASRDEVCGFVGVEGSPWLEGIEFGLREDDGAVVVEQYCAGYRVELLRDEGVFVSYQ